MRFPRKSTCSIFIQICDAVLYLHQSNMIHSYISDHAIMIMSSSHIAKLTNFEYMVDRFVRGYIVLLDSAHYTSLWIPFSVLFIHSVIPEISIAPLQVHYYSGALPSTPMILPRRVSELVRRSGTINCK